MWNQNLLEDVIESKPKNKKVFLVTYYNGRTSRCTCKRLLNWADTINRTHYGLSDLCSRIEYLPTGELLFDND